MNDDNIPVDFVANSVILAAADHAEKNDLRIYHSTSSDLNPISWGEVAQHLIESLAGRIGLHLNVRMKSVGSERSR